MTPSSTLVRSGILAMVTAVLVSTSAATPANAADQRLSPAAERSVRNTMQDAGITPDVEDHLIDKIGAGEPLDSEISSSVPVSSVRTKENARPVTTETFADGSIRTTVELAQTTTGPSNRIYVAHPTLECNLIHCTLIYSRADTRYMATGSFATVSAVIAAACGPVAWACGIAAAIVIDTTHNAYNSGRCIALRKVIAAGPAYPVIASCRK